MFFRACFTMHMRIFTAIQHVIILARSKIVHCLTYVLFMRLVTGKKIDQALVTTAKLVVYSMGFLVTVLVKVSVIKICTSMETFSITFIQYY